MPVRPLIAPYGPGALYLVYTESQLTKQGKIKLEQFHIYEAPFQAHVMYNPGALTQRIPVINGIAGGMVTKNKGGNIHLGLCTMGHV